MDPLHLRLQNFRSFLDLDTALPSGCCGIVGAVEGGSAINSNGAGKSTILLGVETALFGPPPGYRSLEDLYSRHAISGDLMCELTFAHDGETYRARRGWSPKGRGKASLDFERFLPETVLGPEVWDPQTRESIDATQTLICTTLGFPELDKPAEMRRRARTAFRASCYLAQRDGAAFTAAPPAARKQALADVAGLHAYERLHLAARAQKRAAEQDLDRLAGEARALREVADTRPVVEMLLAEHAASVVEAERALVTAEQELKRATDDVRAAEAAAARRQVAEAELARATGELARIQQIWQAGEDATATRMDARIELRGLATPDILAGLEEQESDLLHCAALEAQAIAEYDALKREYELKSAQRNAILGQANELNEKADALREQADSLERRGPGDAHCDRCQQTLGVEALASTLASMQTEADELDAAAGDLDVKAKAFTLPDVGDPPVPDATLADDFAAIQAQLRSARAQQEQRARLEERLRSLQEKIDAGQDARPALEQAESAARTAQDALDQVGETPDLEELSRRVGDAKRLIRLERDTLDQARAQRTRAEAEKDRVEAADAKLADTAKRAKTLHADIDILAACEKAYGRDGIPALLVESQIIPRVETHANRILADLGTPYRVELRTQAELKSGDGLTDTLDIVVIDDGVEALFETFSGGEASRLEIALRIALAMCGDWSRVLMIDEPEGLDEAGMAALVEVLRGLEDRFERVYLVSHVAMLRDAFDHTLAVAKVAGRSRVEVSA